MNWCPPPPVRHLAEVPFDTHGGTQPGEESAARSRILDLSSNVNPFGPDPELRSAIHVASLQEYPDPEARSARRALAKHWGLPTERVLLTPGAAWAIHQVVRSFVSCGQSVVIAGPTFGEYRRAAQLVGARVIEVRDPLDPTRFSSRQLVDAIEQARPVLVFLCSPNNPTGEPVDAATLDSILAAIPSGTLVVLDESYRSFSERTLAPPHRPMDDRVLHVRSFTKDLALPGLRVGSLIGATQLLQFIERGAPPWTVSAGAMAAVEGALQPRLLTRLDTTLEQVYACRLQLEHALKDRGWNVLGKPAANFALFTSRNLQSALLRLNACNVRVRRCDSFGLPHHIRIAAPTEEGLARIICALDSTSPTMPSPP